MRRLLQFGTIMILIAAFIPFLEVFDRWDTPGLSNDTEFNVFALVFAICLVVLVCKLISSAALTFGFIVSGAFLHDDKDKPHRVESSTSLIGPSLLLLPLRI
jgi:hypothetical protein